MRLFMFVLLSAFFSSLAAADTYVNGYVRSDGSYVSGHYRSDRDNNPYNNYSAVGNTNPYTGSQGYVSPYSIPQNRGVQIGR